MSGQARFITSAAQLSQCPPDITREVAVIGRSNVGKSSLLGALLGQPSLVRRSRTPGRTQLMNYFATSHGDVLVDLPGYGFADVPDSVKGDLLSLVRTYLTGRQQLARVILLIDARRGEANPDDLTHYAMARDAGRDVLVVVTKIDRVPKSKRKATVAAVARSIGLPVTQVLAFSAETNEGLGAIKEAIR